MQDIHWVHGAFGYFPSYTLGAMLAAQLGEAMRRDLPELDDHVARGDFAPAIGWLTDKVHRWGSKLPTEELVTAATGEPLGAGAFLRHLRSRYLGETA